MSGMEKMFLLVVGVALVLVGMGLAGCWSSRRQRSKPNLSQFSKWVVADVRALLWVVTIGGFALAFYCVHKGYTGALPWIGAMVGLPWTAHGVICAAYLSLCKSDHKEGGITFESAKASGFQKEPSGQIIGSENSPGI